MHNIISFFRKGRRSIIIVVIAIALLIATIQALNQMVKQQEANKKTVVLTEDEKNMPTESRIGGKTVSLSTTKKNTNAIQQFVDYCNNGKITEAYNMLTDDCKEIEFPTEEKFRTKYYNRVFSQKRIVEMENFLSSNNRYIYLVKFYEDAMATGTVQNVQKLQDYITIDYNHDGKLSINSLIYKQNVNKYTEINGVRMTITTKAVYKENEKYAIKIENNTNKTILIDTSKQLNTVYAVGNNNVMYSSNIAQLSSIVYEISPKKSRNYELSFNKVYSSGVQLKQVVFSDIVADSEKYKQTPDEVKERIKLSISV